MSKTLPEARRDIQKVLYYQNNLHQGMTEEAVYLPEFLLEIRLLYLYE
jgi:hypothetical protein